MAEPDWERLGAAIRARRMEIGAPRQADLADQAGISDTTWNLAETGKVVGQRSLAKIALVLGWTASSAAEVLAGGEPTLASGAAAAIQVDASGTDLSELARLDPEAYELVMRQAALALDRARDRNR